MPPRMSASEGLVARVLRARRATAALIEGLEVEDLVAQSMPDASPAKWHLAHTTWFFDRFVLRPLGAAAGNDSHDLLFNSYYDAVGARHERAKRGLLTRPTVRDVLAYRRAVDARLADLDASPRLVEISAALELGIAHEEQHQELLVTDLKHLFSENPLRPALGLPWPKAAPAHPASWVPFAGGLVEVGHAGPTFSFDNERPRHRVHLEPFALSSRLVTTAEVRAFIEDGGYRRPELWLSDGFVWARTGGRERPLYWENDRSAFTLDGVRELRPDEPAVHLTYYEADAIARWAGARLPTEAEWETAATERPDALDELSHVAWQWTQSAYLPYPGFRPLEGAFGEYNGKFMVGQMVLRGGSSATPKGHTRTTYRNFFPPSAAWQVTGVRLARDA
jgi:ergothioneine biosynthesis protein EgtB